MKISIVNGEIVYLYNDDINLSDIGHINIQRASHVENKDNQWYVDLSPIGINLKIDGFNKRIDALNFEKNYIENHVIQEL